MTTLRALRRSRVLTFSLAGLVCAFCVSCTKAGRPLYPVHGRVLFDGKPMAGGIVILHPLEDLDLGDTKPRALIDADGSFQVYLYRTDDGAPAGSYAVSIFPKKPKKEPGTAKSKGAKRQAKADARAADAAAGIATIKKAKSEKAQIPQAVKQKEKKRELQAAFPARYTDPKTSGLHITVAPGINELEPFQLEK
jgi:hypothetical protein